MLYPMILVEFKRVLYLFHSFIYFSDILNKLYFSFFWSNFFATLLLPFYFW